MCLGSAGHSLDLIPDLTGKLGHLADSKGYAMAVLTEEKWTLVMNHRNLPSATALKNDVPYGASDNPKVLYAMGRGGSKTNVPSPAVEVLNKDGIELVSLDEDLGEVADSSTPLRKGDIVRVIVENPNEEVSMTINSGCPPDRSVHLDLELSEYSRECRNVDPAIPCAYFEDDFLPVIAIYDSIINSSELFTEVFALSIVAGGRDPHSMRNFTEAEIRNYNLGGAEAIWTSLIGPGLRPGTFQLSRGVRSADGQPIIKGYPLTWVCPSGSPCYGIQPRGLETPHYFVRFRLTTDSQITGYSTSYCLHTTEFLVRIHGLQMDITGSLVVTLGTWGAIFGTILIGYAFHYYHRQQAAKAGIVAEPDPALAGIVEEPDRPPSATND
ncbi:hypothetical protein CBR_g16806 [Chara braunii]|uniref:CATSPERG C-terminal domain-containing protein n=1 Tax=Chara braunii TaxID=69332 RepID=A0A388KTS7_CHABU|nr:hypothetical protein CBR_g16806 [Chara braunii]|eukprot:GBG73465.1 hypothetical protein CBR_g16806 [Chara braunii]